MFTRRLFIRFLLGLPLITILPSRLQESLAVPLGREQRNSIGKFFHGEALHYAISVWPFGQVALGRLSFKELEQKGQYMATLQGETLGVLGWVARYRMDTYRSIMQEVEEGRRLRSSLFEENVKIGSKLRWRTHLFDYSNRRWIKTRRRKDGTITRTEVTIPQGMIYDDFITASYNFRYGVYGEIERGRKYRVTTFPKDNVTHYEVLVADRKEEEQRRRSEKVKEGKEYFVKLFLDPEITHSKEGVVEGWLSKELYPLEGRIRDVILFGDVTGKLIKNTKNQVPRE